MSGDDTTSEKRIRFYRAQATELRLLAKRAGSADGESELAALAAQYDTLAATLERGGGPK
jgi:hypothetical protein